MSLIMSHISSTFSKYIFIRIRSLLCEKDRNFYYEKRGYRIKMNYAGHDEVPCHSMYKRIPLEIIEEVKGLFCA